ncbi:hypothetical protein JZ751_013397 [Albula glossodonta]|uniref:Uncharacterized protein n=1 Tax=Albula glossodonta TaxID=121402 RepID=A0A8T2MXT8_9TELE|nr:hypothetical protein JZ751_013397 [Albula glossodonta]
MLFLLQHPAHHALQPGPSRHDGLYCSAQCANLLLCLLQLSRHCIRHNQGKIIALHLHNKRLPLQCIGLQEVSSCTELQHSL